MVLDSTEVSMKNKDLLILLNSSDDGTHNLYIKTDISKQFYPRR
jgi:hypothetical protein